VNVQGTGFVYCGYIGGVSNDRGTGIAVDGAGNAFVTGWTNSTEKTFPVKVGPDLTHNGGEDAFVAKVNAQGTELVYCGYIGGLGIEWGKGIAVDGGGNAYVTGETRSDQQTFPVTVGPGLKFMGVRDAFVAKVNPPGTALVTCGYIGGYGDDKGEGIAVDRAGNPYVAGSTGSDQLTFPVRKGPDLSYNSNNPNYDGDAFVAKIGLVLLQAAGAPRPGSRMTFTLTASTDHGLPYQLGSSLGTGPIPIDQRSLGLSPDGLLWASISGLWPWIFSGYQGVIDSKGRASAAVDIPIAPALVGVRIHSAFMTLSPAAPSGVQSISDTFMFSIGK